MSNTNQTSNTPGLGAMMAGGNPDPERGRAENDFYATPAAVTSGLFREYAAILTGARVWEPCAGDGTMARTLLNRGVGRVVCSDINPLPSVDARVQIAPLDLLSITAMPAVDAIVTNPPFELAGAMLTHIMAMRGGPPQFLALMLKATYWHSIRRAALFDRFMPSAIHPLTWRPDFKNLGRPTMEVMWCVWDQNAATRPWPDYRPMHHPRNPDGSKDFLA